MDKATKSVPDTIKQSIGKLIVVNAGEVEPARKIHYASALITHIRSALFYIANTTDIREFSDVMHVLMYNILKSEFDYDATVYAYERIEGLYHNKPKTRYDALLLSDIALVQQCRGNWRRANSLYFSNVDSWQYSNDMLADIMDTLVEVATRWNLVIIPKEMSFNISQMPNLTIPREPSSPLDE